MNTLNFLKIVGAALKVIGAVSAAYFSQMIGGVDGLFITLMTMIVLDYFTGVLVAIIKKKLSSEVGYKGLAKKLGILVAVAVGNQIGCIMNMDSLRGLVIGFYIANEGISILENLCRAGTPVPKYLIIVLKQLQEQENKDAEQEK